MNNLRLTDETEPEANGLAVEAATAAQTGPWLLTLADLAKLLQRKRRSLERDFVAGRIGSRPIRNLGRALKFSAEEIPGLDPGWLPARQEVARKAR